MCTKGNHSAASFAGTLPTDIGAVKFYQVFESINTITKGHSSANLTAQ